MTKLLIPSLVLLAVGYTLVMLWMVWFTFAFFGFEALGNDPLVVIIVVAMALSPIPIWIYCVRRITALRRGESPKV